MKFVFFEAPAFTRMVTKYLDDDEYRELLAPAERQALKRTIQTELEARRRSND